MPPHPDMIEEYKKNGQLKSLLSSVESISSKMNMNSPSKAFPSSGTRKVPVLMVNYATPYTVSSDPLLYIGNIKKRNIAFYGMFFVFITIMLIALRKYRFNSTLIFRPFIPVYLALFVFLISCGIDDGDDDDDTFPTDPSVYSRILNGNSSSDLSVRKYFQDMSDNNLNLQFDIYGPVKVSKAWEYYGKNNNSIIGDDLHPGELVSEALRIMVSRYSSVDFSLYDNDNNGYVDSVIIIHEGRGEESGGGADTIWSHQWDLASAASYGDGNGPVNAGDGVTFNVYTIQPEYTVTRGDSSMGVYAHEFGHVLGLPDLYDTSNATYGVGDWSLMASGSWKGPVTNDGTTPAPLLAWERFKTGGSSWVSLSLPATTDDQAIDNIETSKAAFKIMLSNTAGQVQYLIIEGRVLSTSSQWYVPGTGLLISHIHESIISYFTAADAVNAGSSRIHGINILEKTGTDLWDKTSTGDSSDLFITGDTIAGAIKYDSSAPGYSLLPATGTTVSITDVKVTTVPVSFDYTP
jgi:M6 family metalloprotease-like protein